MKQITVNKTDYEAVLVAIDKGINVQLIQETDDGLIVEGSAQSLYHLGYFLGISWSKGMTSDILKS